MKDLRVTKIVKEIKFEGVWGELEVIICFQRQPFTKYLRLTLVSMWNSALREKFKSLFFNSFLLVMTRFTFCQKNWALGYHSKITWHSELKIWFSERPLNLEPFTKYMRLTLVSLWKSALRGKFNFCFSRVFC